MIAASGWYTLQHRFYDNAGTLSVDMNILDAAGLSVASRTIHTAFAMATVGGDRYGWFANQEVHDLAIDNAELRTSTNAVKQDIRDDLAAYRATVTDNQDGKRLDDAIKHLDKSLAPALWTDATHVNSPKVFDEEKKAVQKLVEIQKDANSTVPDATAQSFIDRIVAVDRQLAVTEIGDAAGGNANELAKANQELAKGDQDAAAGKPATAIDHYKHAWEHARKA